MNARTKSTPPTTQQLAYRKALEECMATYALAMDAIEILAVLSHLVGQVIALQDQRTVTPEMAMQIVIENIQQGNRDAISPLLTQTGGNA